MCTLELDPRLVDRCHLQTLSSDKAISRITSEGGGKTKALSNLKTTVGACRNRSRALGDSIRSSRDRSVLVLSFCVRSCLSCCQARLPPEMCLLLGRRGCARADPIPRTNSPGLWGKEIPGSLCHRQVRGSLGALTWKAICWKHHSQAPQREAGFCFRT